VKKKNECGKKKKKNDRKSNNTTKQTNKQTNKQINKRSQPGHLDNFAVHRSESHLVGECQLLS
jgi:hypothetical protein